MAGQPSKPAMPTSFRGINHLKLPALSIQKTHDFYTKILPFTPLPQFDHFTPEHKVFAKMFLYEPTKLIIEVRHVPDQAVAQKGWDPITYGVGTRQDLQEWADWLDANGVRRSPIFTGIKSWVMACEDPDGRIVRLYVEDEEHEWTDQPDTDEFWLGSAVADPGTEMDGEEARTPLPEETVEKIVAMMPFPSIFKARSLSKSWLARLSSIPFQNHEEKKLRISSLQREVSQWSSNWPTFCAIFIGREEIIAYDLASQSWRQLSSVSFLPDSMFLRNCLNPFNCTAATHSCLPESYYQIEGALLYAFSLIKIGHYPEYYQKETYVANICTRSWKQLPTRPREDRSFVLCSKLVCDIPSNSYKVILFSRIIHGGSDFTVVDNSNDYAVQIYDPKSNAWTTQMFTRLRGHYQKLSCAHLDGVLYMVSHRLGDSPNLLTFNLAEGSLEEFTLSFNGNNRTRNVHIDLLVCNATRLVMVTWGVNPEEMQVLKVDLESLQLLELSQGLPTSFRIGSIRWYPVTHGHCIHFLNFRVDCDSGVLEYNVDDDMWSSFPIPATALSRNGERCRWVGSSCQPGLNPFAGV